MVFIKEDRNPTGDLGTSVLYIKKNNTYRVVFSYYLGVFSTF